MSHLSVDPGIGLYILICICARSRNSCVWSSIRWPSFVRFAVFWTWQWCSYVRCGSPCVYVRVQVHCIFIDVLFCICMHHSVLVWLCVMWSVLCLWHFRLLLLTLDNPLPTILLATTTKKPFDSRSARASTSTLMSTTITTAIPKLGQPCANHNAGNHNQEIFPVVPPSFQG